MLVFPSEDMLQKTNQQIKGENQKKLIGSMQKLSNINHMSKTTLYR
jgi:hypothetical protein